MWNPCSLGLRYFHSHNKSMAEKMNQTCLCVHFFLPIRGYFPSIIFIHSHIIIYKMGELTVDAGVCCVFFGRLQGDVCRCRWWPVHSRPRCHASHRGAAEAAKLRLLKGTVLFVPQKTGVRGSGGGGSGGSGLSPLLRKLCLAPRNK